MTYAEITHLLAELPNYSDPPRSLSPDDRAWLCDFRLRFAGGAGCSPTEEARLLRLVRDCGE